MQVCLIGGDIADGRGFFYEFFLNIRKAENGAFMQLHVAWLFFSVS